MTVHVWISGQLEPEKVEGDLLDLTYNLNLAAAQGKQYALLDGEDGEFMVQTKLITKAKEDEDTSSYIGAL
jgi:hypothetical protein